MRKSSKICGTSNWKTLRKRGRFLANSSMLANVYQKSKKSVSVFEFFALERCRSVISLSYDALKKRFSWFPEWMRKV